MAVDGLKSGGCNQWTGGIVEQLLGSMHSVASPNLGILLIGFLHVFGWAIDFTQVRLVTKVHGRSVFSLSQVADLFKMGSEDGFRECDVLTPSGGRKCEGEVVDGERLFGGCVFSEDDAVLVVCWF